MDKNRNKNKNQDYIREAKEWHEHQYNPSNHTGGRIPPFLKSPRRLKWLGLVYIVCGIIALTIIIYLSVEFFDITDIIPFIISVILVTGIGAIYVLAGIRLIRKKNNQKRKK